MNMKTSPSGKPNSGDRKNKTLCNPPCQRETIGASHSGSAGVGSPVYIFVKHIFALLLVSFFGGLYGCAGSGERLLEYVYPPPPEKPRIKLVSIIKGNDYFRKTGIGKVLTALAGEQPGALFERPYAVTTDATGNIYVTDTGLKKVFVIDSVSQKIRTIGDRGTGRLQSPIGVLVTPSGRIFVADSKLKRVLAFNAEGELLDGIGEEGEFNSPTGIAFDPASGRLYVVDTNNHIVRVYTEEGEYLFSFGRRGGADGEFNFPTNITVRGDKVYVVDTMNGRVQIFSTEGKFLDKFGKLGNTPGHFSRPKGIAVDSYGHIYVVDAAFDNFQIFNDNGQPLMFVGQAGSGAAEFQLPAGIFVDKSDYIYVVDQLNARVQVFKFIGQD